jgi:hypothetical protein
MKVYTSITMDMDGNTLSEESYEYTGPVALCGGSKTSTTVSTLPAPTAAQTETEKINLDMLRRQATAMVRNEALQDPDAAKAYLEMPPEQRPPDSPFAGLEKQDNAAFRTQLDQAKTSNEQQRSLTDLANRRMIEQVTGVARLTPGEQGLLDETFKSAQTEGTSDITRSAQEAAAMRGLNVSDSPIMRDLGQNLQRFNTGIQSAKAQASLNLGESSKIFNESVRQFQAGLSQQAQMNRMNLATQTPGIASPLMGSLAGQRMAQGTQTTTQKQGIFQDVMQGMGAIGSVAGGVGAVMM